MATVTVGSDDVDIIVEETRLEDVISSSRSVSENQAVLILQDDQSAFLNSSDVIEIVLEATNDLYGVSSNDVTSEILNEIIDLTFVTSITALEVITSYDAVVENTNTDELKADSRSEIDTYIQELIDSLAAELVNENTSHVIPITSTEVLILNEVRGAENPITVDDIYDDMSLELTFVKLSIGVVREQCLDLAIEAMLEIEISSEEESGGRLSILAAEEPIVLSTLSPSSTKDTFHRAASIVHVEKISKSPTKIVVQSSHSVAAAATSVYEFPDECINTVDKEIDGDAGLSSENIKMDIIDPVIEQSANETSVSETLPVPPTDISEEAVEIPLVEEPPARGPPKPLARYQSFEDDTVITSEMIADRKAAKLKQLRYGNKEPPAEEPKPQEVPPVDADIANMMKSTTARLKAFDYSKIRGSKLGGRAPPAHHRPPGKLTPKKPTRDLYRPPANFFYEYEDLVRVNQEKVYYNLNEKELETYLTTADFERVFSMTRAVFYDQPLWKQQAEKKDKNLF